MSYGYAVGTGGIGPLTVSNTEEQIVAGGRPNGVTPSAKEFRKVRSLDVPPVLGSSSVLTMPLAARLPRRRDRVVKGWL